MATGTVKWFNPAKGFGFIQPAEGGADVFVHISAVERAGLQHLADGQPVTYELVEGKGGKSSAENIELNGPAPEGSSRPRSSGGFGGDRPRGGGGGYGDRPRSGGGGGGYSGDRPRTPRPPRNY
jgi:CspA family cold shock protein